MPRPRLRVVRAGARLILALTLAATSGIAAAQAAAVEINAQALPLNPDRPDDVRVGRLEYRGGLALASPDKRFGGFSALHVSRDGAELLALSDRGYWLTARPRYDERGRLTGLDGGQMGMIVDLEGRPIGRTDVEAMAKLPSGEALLAFEDSHGLWLYPASKTPFEHRPTVFHAPPGLASAPRNAGVKALARLNDGRFLAIAEKLPAAGREGAKANAAWVGGAPGWRRLSYRRTGAYLPTDAATLPPATRWEGNVVVAERAFNIVDGISIRIALVPFDQIRPGHRMTSTEIARFARPLTFDAVEGVAARRGPQGETLLYLITDDNYSPVQRTLLQVFELKE